MALGLEIQKKVSGIAKRCIQYFNPVPPI